MKRFGATALLSATVLWSAGPVDAQTTAQPPAPQPQPRPAASAPAPAATAPARPAQQAAPAPAAPLTLPGAGAPAPTAPPPASVAAPAGAPGVARPGAAPTPPAAGQTAFTPEQRAIVERVNTYFNQIQSMVGDFVQVGPDGSRTTGRLYLQKPGRIRFEYAAPSPVELIADGSAVAVRDRRLNTQDIYPLSQTPLRYLLSERINLMRDANVVRVAQDDMFVTVVLEERHAVAGTNRLTILFGTQDNQLRQWTVTDAQGFDTTVAVHNVDTAQRPDPRLFRINYERMLE